MREFRNISRRLQLYFIQSSFVLICSVPTTACCPVSATRIDYPTLRLCHPCPHCQVDQITSLIMLRPRPAPPLPHVPFASGSLSRHSGLVACKWVHEYNIIVKPEKVIFSQNPPSRRTQSFHVQNTTLTQGQSTDPHNSIGFL